MKSDMHESASSLAPLNYIPYLKLLSETIQQTPLFTISQQTLRINSASLAQQMAAQVKAREGTRDELPALFSYNIPVRLATVHLDENQTLHEMGKQTEALRASITTLLATVISSSTLSVGAPADYVPGLLHSLPKLHQNIPKGLHYPFLEKQALSKRRVHIQSQASRPPAANLRYRGHKLTITLGQTSQFENNLIDGFCLLLQSLQANADEIAEVRTVLQRTKEDTGSEIARLKKLIKEETLGKIKGEACWRFWAEVMDDMTRTHARLQQVSRDEQAGLVELRRQFQMLTRFRQMLVTPPAQDLTFQVRYAGEFFDVRTIFERSSDSYNVLPIIPEVVGTLGEVQDLTKDEQTFAYGMRFKLNGSVGKIPSAFQYYVGLLDASTTEHQKRLSSPRSKRYFAEEVIRIAILYYVLFILDDDATFEKRLKEFLARLGDEDSRVQEKLLRQLIQRLLKKTGETSPQVEIPVEQARTALEEYFRHASVGPVISPFLGYLVLQNGMLRINRNRMLTEKRFFRKELFTKEEERKEALRYITVQDAIPQQAAFYVLPLQIAFEPIYLSESATDPVENASMVYAIDNWMMLPVLFIPDTQTSQMLAERAYKLYRRIEIPYREEIALHENDPELAMYRWAFLLLNYLCLDILWGQIIGDLIKQEKRLFYPMIRIHSLHQEIERTRNNDLNEGKVMSGMTKTLAHIFSGERNTLSNAQGFSHDALQTASFKLSNGLSSLYNVLPRVITRPATAPNELDKLAIIVISSRRSDWHTESSFQRMCVYGERIGCIRMNDGTLRVEQLATFADNDNSDDLYTTPTTLLDQVRRCVREGYRHIFYIAKAPYTSHVHFTGKEEGEELFFMSPKIIGGVLEAFPGVQLYPMFCDRYYVVKVNKTAMNESLYVDDTKELRTLLTDPSKSTVVFFNVMNGIQIRPTKGEKGHRYYNGVVSYSTLINMYSNPLYDQPIRNNLLDGSQPGSLRKDMLDFLAYVHGVRYERREKAGVQLKLDPYEAYIGFDSVGARSIIPSFDSRVQTNMLAFLALMRGLSRRKRQQSPNGSQPPAAPLSPEDTPLGEEPGADGPNTQEETEVGNAE